MRGSGHLVKRLQRLPGKVIHRAVRAYGNRQSRYIAFAPGDPLRPDLGGRKAQDIRLIQGAGRARAAIFIDPGQLVSIRQQLVKTMPEQTARDRELSERLLEGKIPILGHGLVSVGLEPAWNRDYISGRQWDSGFYRAIDVIDPANPTDIKIPWEISRFHHLAFAGKMYALTGDDRYSRYFHDHFRSWLRSNPPLYGVNWTCAMEVGIRLINLIFCYALFADSDLFDDRFEETFLATLYNHLVFIRNNLENKGIAPNNHYLANLTALHLGALLVGEVGPFRDIRRWALARLVEESRRQINSDGSYFEGSVPYHRLAAELFILPLLFEERAARADGEDAAAPGPETLPFLKDRVLRMFEFMCAYTMPDGSAPQIGDNDGGQVLNFCSYGQPLRQTHLDLLAVAGAFYGRRDWMRSDDLGELAVWLCPDADPGRETASPRRESGAFPDIGLYIMRSGDDCLMAKCGANGTGGVGTHSHNDNLSVLLTCNGAPILVDPGTWCYTRSPAVRNRFRSTQRHNTVTVDGLEMNDLSLGPFTLGNTSRPRILNWIAGEDRDILEAEHTGYERAGVVHRRTVVSRKDRSCWTITDTFLGEGRHTLEWNLHFDSHLSIKGTGGLIEVSRQGRTLVLVQVEEFEHMRHKVYGLSRNYGHLEPAWKTIVSCQRSLPFTNTIIITGEDHGQG